MKSLLLFIPFLLFQQKINNVSNDTYISSWQELKVTLNRAENGDTIYVDDIDFRSGTGGLYSLFERINVDKSVTIIGKEDGSIFTHGSFDIIGKSTYQDTLNISFKNISFVEYEDDNKNIPISDWETDESASTEIPVKCQYATSFTGNVIATFDNCRFIGYMDVDGAAMHADYSASPESKLSLSLNNCVFDNNAGLHSGGCFTLRGNEKNINLNIIDSTFSNNISGVVQGSGFGGGVLYGDNIDLHVNNSQFLNNVGNHLYLDSTTNQDATSGGAIYLINSSIDINNSIFKNNKASLGGAIRANKTNSIFTNCVFENNRVEAAYDTDIDKGKYSNKEMGAVYYQTGFNGNLVTFNNCIIASNTSKNVYAGIYIPQPFSPSSTRDELILNDCFYYDNVSETTTFYYAGDEEENIFEYPAYHVNRSVVIDDTFTRYYPTHQLPNEANNYCYISDKENAVNDGIYGETAINQNSDILKVDVSIYDLEEDLNIFGTPFLGPCFAQNINFILKNNDKIIEEITFANQSIVNIEITPKSPLKTFKYWTLTNNEYIGLISQACQLI